MEDFQLDFKVYKKTKFISKLIYSNNIKFIEKLSFKLK